MKFALSADEPLASGLVRVMDAHVGHLRALGQRGDLAVDDYVHAARVCCKRMRAALGLCRPVLGRDAHRRHDHWWRDAARGLSRLRDLAARSDALADMAPDIVPVAGIAAVESARVQFAVERQETGQLDGAQAIARFARALEHAPRVSEQDLAGASARDLVRAIGRTYRDARRAMHRAFESGEIERFHDWRKLAKQHALHVRLAKRVFPALQDRAEAASELGRQLGHLQDVSVVMQGLGAQGQAISHETDRSQVRLHQVLAAEAERLVEQVRKPGSRLFGKKRRAFERKVLSAVG